MIVVFAIKKTVTMSAHEKGYYETNTKIAKAWRDNSNKNSNRNNPNSHDANHQQLQQDVDAHFDGYIGR